MFLLYNIVLTLTAPIWVSWMLLRARKRKPMPNWKQRTGQYDLPKHDQRVWLHAVSVGEVIAAKPILQALRAEMPKAELLVSVTTSSGFQTASDQLAGLADHVVYFPIDVARFQLAAMQRIRPAVAVLMETELWFNFLWAADTFETPVLLVNGRVSERSFRGMQRVAPFYRAMAGYLTSALMQTESDAERIRAFGAKDVRVLGNSKFDQAADTAGRGVAEWRNELGLATDEPLVVFGSIRVEEFALLWPCVRELLPHARVVFAPRHVDRLAELLAITGDQVALRSQSAQPTVDKPLILDTYGELSSLYSVATVAVIGGSFANLGGQNLIQPLAHGVPVLHGPYMKNFRDVAASAAEAGCTVMVESSTDLVRQIRQALEDTDWRSRASESARVYVHRNQGASWRYAQEIARAARPKKKAGKRKS